jgi:hypothetical protein
MDGKNDQLHAPAALLVETLLRIDYKAARPHSQPGYFVDEKNF